MKDAVWQGLLSGAAGVTAMTIGEKLEQLLTGRADSHVPARVLRRLVGRDDPGQSPQLANWIMHLGQGVVLGILRSAMAHAGLRGPWASAKFAVLRLTNDQILENATGVGAPPPSWPRDELAVDLVHKAVYAAVTGIVADALAARSGPADVGPLPPDLVDSGSD